MSVRRKERQTRGEQTYDLVDGDEEDCVVDGAGFFVADEEGETLAFCTAWSAGEIDDNEGVEGFEATVGLDGDPPNAIAMVPVERWGQLRETYQHVTGN